MFADDAKVYRELNKPEDHVALQLDLDRRNEWSKGRQFIFNETKCKCMHFGCRNPKFTYAMNYHFLESTNEEKNIGFIADDSLKFHRHAAAAVKKANSALGVIKKNCTTLDTTTLPLLMVRPHLEYENVIWGPYYKGNQVIFEKVQKRATK